jgi:hypothetical protein
MFDKYDEPQKPFQLTIEYVKNRWKDFDLDISDTIRYTIDTIQNVEFKKKMYECLYNKDGRDEVIKKIKTLVSTLDAMDNRHITNIGARLYMGNDIWMSIQVWRRKPEYWHIL